MYVNIMIYRYELKNISDYDFLLKICDMFFRLQKVFHRSILKEPNTCVYIEF